MAASREALEKFGREVGANVVKDVPGSLLGDRMIDFAGRTASKKLRAAGYSALDANVAALAASAYVRDAAKEAK